MADSMRVAGVQLVSSEDPAENLDLVRDGIVRAADLGARLVVFPEATIAPFTR